MRTIRSKFIAAALAGAAVVAGFAMPGQAATDATFEITGGLISISEPAGVVDFGAVAVGTPLVTGNLGGVTVSDERGALAASWTASVAASDFATPTATVDAERVLQADIDYTSGVGLAELGEVGAFVPSVAVALAGPQTAGAWTGTGQNHVTWDPTIVFNLRTDQVAGVYEGTITHSLV